MNLDRATALENALETALVSRAEPPLAAKLAPQLPRTEWASEPSENRVTGLATGVLFCLANSLVVVVFAHAFIG
jgi:hypothetical protein